MNRDALLAKDRSKGFGFEVVGEEDAIKAIRALNGKELGGRALTVNEAKPMVKRGPYGPCLLSHRFGGGVCPPNSQFPDHSRPARHGNSYLPATIDGRGWVCLIRIGNGQTNILLRQTKAQNEFGGALKELIEQIAKALVDNSDQVSVRLIEGEQATVFELRVAQSDLGKVIGRQGRTASSIRTIISAEGMKLKKRFKLEILE
jgi:predicted RNA-binding protein YlqC (UPF0109 family)